MRFKNRCILIVSLLWLGISVFGQNTPEQKSTNKSVDKRDALQSMLESLRAQELARGYSNRDFSEFDVESRYELKETGATRFHLKQTIQGIPVFNAIASGIVDRNGKTLFVSNSFQKNAIGRAAAASPTLSAEQAIQRAASLLGREVADRLEALDLIGGAAQTQIFAGGSLSQEPIKAHLAYFEKNGTLHLSWQFTIVDFQSPDAWEILIDAISGEELGRFNLTIYDSFPSLKNTKQQANKNRQNLLPQPSPARGTVGDGSAYYVLPIPVESPIHGNLALVQNPADATASPFGWHDTNGAAGAEFTITRGNNVHAFQDRDGNQASAGDEPNGGANLQFTDQPDLTAVPRDYKDEATVNLFFWNNLMHDLVYAYGFDEAAGNFQTNNYGNGGTANDYVMAHAQSGADIRTDSLNNANFSTPSDGSRPRMRMYEWTASDSHTVTITSPAGAAGTFDIQASSFGPTVLDPTVFTGASVVDITAPTNDGCEDYSNNLQGKLAIIYRGTCNFGDKVHNAEAEGALAVIVVNNVAGNDTISMGLPAPADFPNRVFTIPSFMIGKNDGDQIVNAIGSGDVSMTIDVNVPNRDSDFDAGIIAHEYGHGISNRLTGGPNNVTCLQNTEQAGEGWSDFYALVFTARPDDEGTDARGIGNYASFLDPDGSGIRPTPYSTDMNINPSTYDTIKDTANISAPHGIGYVFCTMLWEMYWALVEEHGFDPDFYAGTGGNNIAINLVTQGLAMQVCSPGFVDARDAILAADTAIYGGANQCLIWRAFAKRGLGLSATQGSSSNRSDGTQAFDVPQNCSCLAASIVSSPADQNVCLDDTVVMTVEASGTDLTYQWQKDNVDINGATTDTLTLENVTGDSEGDYSCVVTNNCSSEETTAATLTVSEPQSYSAGATSVWPGAFPEPACDEVSGNARADILDFVDMVNRSN